MDRQIEQDIRAAAAAIQGAPAAVAEGGCGEEAPVDEILNAVLAHEVSEMHGEHADGQEARQEDGAGDATSGSEDFVQKWTSAVIDMLIAFRYYYYCYYDSLIFSMY